MSIFGEKELTLNHWRYRILHWCFNVRNVTDPADSPLPNYLYSHYCPLFHLTNLIALFSWLILGIRFTVISIKVICSFLARVDIGLLLSNILQFFKSDTQQEEHRERTQEELIEAQWKMFEHKFNERASEGSLSRFDLFWSSNEFMFGLLDKEDAERQYQVLFDILREKEIRQEKRKALIQNLIQFSRYLFAGIWYTFIACLVCFLALVVYTFFFPTIELIVSLFESIGEFFVYAFNLMLSLTWEDVLPYLNIVGSVIGITILLTGLFIFMSKFKTGRKLSKGLSKIGSACLLFPLLLLTRVIGFPFMMLWKLFVATKTFVGEFYETHCPPIVIVDELPPENEVAI